MRRTTKITKTDSDVRKIIVDNAINVSTRINEELTKKNESLKADNKNLEMLNKESEDRKDLLNKEISELSVITKKKQNEYIQKATTVQSQENRLKQLDDNYAKREEELKKEHEMYTKKRNMEISSLKKEEELIKTNIKDYNKEHKQMLDELTQAKEKADEQKVIEKNLKDIIKTMNTSLDDKKKESKSLDDDIEQKKKDKSKSLQEGEKYNELTKAARELQEEETNKLSLLKNDTKTEQAKLDKLRVQSLQLVKKEHKMNKIIPKIDDICEQIGIDSPFK